MVPPAKPGPVVGDLLTLDIHDLTLDGAGVGQVDGFDVSTHGCYPGERVEVRVVARSRHHPRVYGRLRKWESMHPERRHSPCAHHPVCSGCPLIELTLPAQHDLKRHRASRILGVDVGPLVHDPKGELCYRYSTKRVAFGRPGMLWLGSFRRNNHLGAGMRTCPVDHPKLIVAAEEVAAIARQHAIEPYDETTKEGDLRYVWLKTDGERVVVTLITASATSKAAELLPYELQFPSAVAWSVQTGSGNAIRGRKAEVLRGDATLELKLGDDLTFSCGPLGFLQPNPVLAARAYRDLVSTTDGQRLTGQLAYDLYAGTGATTQLLRRNFATVIPCEAYPESAHALGVQPQKATDFLTEQTDRPDVVVANPPRGGMGHRVCEQLLALAAPRLHIMSCSAEALARDLEVLCRDGGYRQVEIRAYDTLPQTTHLELVVWLEYDYTNISS